MQKRELLDSITFALSDSNASTGRASRNFLVFHAKKFSFSTQRNFLFFNANNFSFFQRKEIFFFSTQKREQKIPLQAQNPTFSCSSRHIYTKS